MDNMKQTPRQRAIQDERDTQIEKDAKVYALEWMTAITQVLTVMCILKKNSAWKGTLSILFFGAAFILFYKFGKYTAKPYRQVGVFFLLIGIALLVWFGITG